MQWKKKKKSIDLERKEGIIFGCKQPPLDCSNVTLDMPGTRNKNESGTSIHVVVTAYICRLYIILHKHYNEDSTLNHKLAGKIDTKSIRKCFRQKQRT